MKDRNSRSEDFPFSHFPAIPEIQKSSQSNFLDYFPRWTFGHWLFSQQILALETSESLENAIKKITALICIDPAPGSS